MGVSGCGKSTIGSALASKLNRPFKDGDSFHPPESIKIMSSGVALTDVNRLPWLKAINLFARNNPGHVIACSSLKKSYRSILSEHVPSATFILLNLKREVLQKRVSSRPGHFMPALLLDSQLATLEMPGCEERNVIVIDANDNDVDEVVNSIISVIQNL